MEGKMQSPIAGRHCAAICKSLQDRGYSYRTVLPLKPSDPMCACASTPFFAPPCGHFHDNMQPDKRRQMHTDSTGTPSLRYKPHAKTHTHAQTQVRGALGLG